MTGNIDLHGVFLEALIKGYKLSFCRRAVVDNFNCNIESKACNLFYMKGTDQVFFFDSVHEQTTSLKKNKQWWRNLLIFPPISWSLKSVGKCWGFLEKSKWSDVPRVNNDLRSLSDFAVSANVEMLTDVKMFFSFFYLRTRSQIADRW